MRRIDHEDANVSEELWVSRICGRLCDLQSSLERLAEDGFRLYMAQIASYEIDATNRLIASCIALAILVAKGDILLLLEEGEFDLDLLIGGKGGRL